MAATFNRKPLSVNIPSNSDKKFFNHFNWKGINQNKNFLAVDQETFSDALNVYVDDEGLLKSRPAIRHKHKFVGKDIKDLKVFDDVIVCTYIGIDGEWYIGIIDNEEWIIDYKVFADYPLKAFKNGNYLYVFTNRGFITYNQIEKQITENDYYIPITRIYLGSNYESYEDDNLLSLYTKYRYQLFPTVSGEYISDSINSNAIGKIGTYTHYINETKVSHEIEIDDKGNYLNLIHQTLLNDKSDTFTINCYGNEVSTIFIYENIIYKYVLGDTESILYSADVKTGIFSSIFVNPFGRDSFVKFRLSSDKHILLIHDASIRVLRLDGTLISSGISNAVGLYIDADVLIMNDGECTATVLYIDTRADSLNDLKDSFNNASTSEYIANVCLSYYNARQSKVFTIKLKEIYKLSPAEFTCRINTDCLIVKTYNEQFGENYRSAAVFDMDICGNRVMDFFDAKPAHYFLFGDLEEAYMYNYNYIPNSSHQYNGTTLVHYALTYETRLYGEIVLKSLFAFGESRAMSDTDVFYGVTDIIPGNILKSFEKHFTLPFGNMSSYYYNGDLYKVVVSRPYLHVNGSDYNITTFFGKFIINSFSKYWFHVVDNENAVLSNYRTSVEEIDVLVEKSSETLEITKVNTLLKTEHLYLVNGSNFYIGDIVIDINDDKEKLYFKKANKHILDNKVLSLHQISDKELAIFTSDDTWYVSEIDGIFYYNKSKIVPTIKGSSDVVTLPDSTTTLLPSSDGIIALSYQNFVNTTEQSTLNLTQDLTSIYSIFNKNIKVLEPKWLIDELIEMINIIYEKHGKEKN